MPRRPGYGSAPGVTGISGPERSAEDVKHLRAKLSSFISAGVLHKSACPDWDRKGSAFQVLEWLGDSVLHLYSTQQAIHLFAGAGATEGQMSGLRNSCNSTVCLARAFRTLDLGRLLRHPGGPETMPHYLLEEKKCADVVEAILGELFEEAKREAEAAAKGSAAPASVNGMTACELMRTFLDFIFRLGIEECPMRLKPAAPSRLWLLSTSPTVEGATTGGAAGGDGSAGASTGRPAEDAGGGTEGSARCPAAEAVCAVESGSGQPAEGAGGGAEASVGSPAADAGGGTGGSGEGSAGSPAGDAGGCAGGSTREAAAGVQGSVPAGAAGGAAGDPVGGGGSEADVGGSAAAGSVGSPPAETPGAAAAGVEGGGPADAAAAT